ncbi:hypothetical protein THRCLA_06089 [Thraustotheca clavata]|uniref:Uncharacterized protein n=1 Tax=Thraustotheca clavata TaxID=74557 RepID=A0A1V9ZQJ6_9STRA|nr:hypothetical protein THRCLA_06089 [Thraustotheca clavata]
MQWIYLVVLLPLLDWIPSRCVSKKVLKELPTTTAKEEVEAIGRVNLSRIYKVREQYESLVAYHLIPLVICLWFLQMCSIYEVALNDYAFGVILAGMLVLVAQCVRYAVTLQGLQYEQGQWEAWQEHILSPNGRVVVIRDRLNALSKRRQFLALWDDLLVVGTCISMLTFDTMLDR